MSTHDPFSDEADPYRHEAKVARRELARLLAVPVLAAPLISACGHVPLGCKSEPGDERSCRHRFCRYHRD